MVRSFETGSFLGFLIKDLVETKQASRMRKACSVSKLLGFNKRDHLHLHLQYLYASFPSNAMQ